MGGGGGESAGSKIFPSGEANQPIFGQCVEALFHLASNENPVIFVQFAPKYQNPMSPDSLCRSLLT